MHIQRIKLNQHEGKYIYIVSKCLPKNYLLIIEEKSNNFKMWKSSLKHLNDSMINNETNQYHRPLIYLTGKDKNHLRSVSAKNAFTESNP